MFKRFLISATLVASSASLPAAPQALDQIAVIVNESVILRSEVNERVLDLRLQQQKQGVKDPDNARLFNAAQEQLILESLQLQLASRNGIRADNARVNLELAQMAKQNGMSLEAFQRKLDATPGTSFAKLREAISRETIIEEMRKRRLNDRIRISESDVDQFMASSAGAEISRQLDSQLKPKPQPAQPTQVTEYHASQIIIPLDASLGLKEEAAMATVARKLLAMNHQGKTPEQAIESLRNVSMNMAIEPLGWRQLSNMPEAVRDDLSQQAKGANATLIRSERGWHIVWLLGERQQTELTTQNLLPPTAPAKSTLVKQRRVRHILMRPNELQSIEDVREIMTQLYDQLMAGADFAELAQIKSQDPGSAAKGGDLDWVNPGDMVPEFDRMIGQTAVGNISQPFQTNFGWHILRVEGEREQDMRDKVLRDRARQILYARAYDEELAAWLRELRSEAYVDFRGQPQ